MTISFSPIYQSKSKFHHLYDSL